MTEPTVTLSDWIPVTTPPTIEGVYQTIEIVPHLSLPSIGFQRYKDGYWGGWSPNLETHKNNYPEGCAHFETSYPPSYYRVIL